MPDTRRSTKSWPNSSSPYPPGRAGTTPGSAWDRSEAPAEYEEVLEEYDRAWDDLFAAQLDEHGEPEIAALFRADRENYYRRFEAGREFFHGPISVGELDDQEWLEMLLDTVDA